MAEPVPSPEAAASAVDRAVAYLRLRRRDDPRFAHCRPSALIERVVGLPGQATPAGGGWWVVGRVVDQTVHEEPRVWLHPASGRVRLERPKPVAWPEPLATGGRYFDGATLRWIDPAAEEG